MQLRSQELYDKLALMQTIRQVCDSYETVSDQCFSALDLTGVEGELLLYLLQDPSQITEIECLNIPIPSAALAVALKRLKQKGYIHCTKQRGKGTQVSLTVRAMELQKQLLEQAQLLETGLYSQLSDAEQTRIRQTLRRLLKNLTVSSDRTNRECT